jgi:hypothetical protein
VSDESGPAIVLSDAHREYLAAHAVDPDLALKLGVRTVTSRADMEALGNATWENFSNFPAILFPWTGPDGRVMFQARPDDPTNDPKTGRPRKYVFGRGEEPVLWALREVEGSEKMVIIEGTKQGLAGATYAPPGVSVYSIAGCRMWQIEGSPIPDLMVAYGKEVVVILDADAGENPDVYQAGMGLADALGLEGATKVTFGRLPGGGKSGLDDVLASRPADRRAVYLAALIDRAKPKPADKAPTRKKRPNGAPTGGGERKTIVVNRDRWEVINDLAKALLDRWNASELFNHGGVISRRSGDTMTPVDRGTFHDIVQATAMTVNENEGAQGTTYSFAWPDSGTMSAVMSRAGEFAPLDRLAHAPFVRPDGTIVTEPGYDEATRTILMPDEVFAGIEVPENPTAAEITAARELIMTEWLGDFPLDAAADRANLLALVVTPAIRGMVPRAPLAVLDGLQMGVGKNLLADSILTVYTGHAAQPMNWVEDADELRKQITSAFRTGAEFFVFDEAHTLEGTALAQALTAETWQDRILGVSTMAYFPNRVTWLSLGNNVQVKGDITRRVYRIALRPTYSNPQDRAASSFRHPGQSGLDLGSWTRKHRRELMVAILTLVRAWYAAGSPYPKRGVSFGSFEVWERTVGGIVEAAGLESFLANLKVWRSESDFDTQYWIGHLAFLREQFGDATFKTSDVKNKALSLGTDNYAAPPKLDDPSEKTYGKALGEAYGRISGRRYGGYWLEKAGMGHGHVNVYRVFQDGDLPPAPTEPTPDPVDKDVDIPMPDPAPENEHAEARGPAPEDTDGAGHDEVRGADWTPDSEVSGVVVFDLETGDADDQFVHPGPGYTRIGATAEGAADVVAYDGPGSSVPRQVMADIRTGAVVTGHNIMAFDLPVLVREGVADMSEVHRMAAAGRLADTILMARYLDPPMARDKGVDATRKYDLGTLGAKYELGEKLSDVSKPLAKKYGGWGEIPIDRADPDPERAADATAFQGYMVQDVELSRGLYARLLDELGGTMPDYLVREHRVAALAAQISLNGFLVDQDLLGQRVAQVEATKAKALAYLHANHGVPLANEKGVEYKSPLATKAGKEAIEAALVSLGVPSHWLIRTPNAGDLQLSGEAMVAYAAEFGMGNLALRKLCVAVHRIVSARSVYHTIQANMRPDGRVHPKVSMSQATGRWSLTSPGLTVLGKRGGRHVERAVLLPDPGQVIIAADLSQVDMRAVAGLSQDQGYIEMLKHDDPHTELAVALFGDAGFREKAKAIGHGWNYGESLRRISTENDIDPQIVNTFDTSMRDRFGRLVEWREEVRALATSGALLDNGWGRAMRADPQRAHTQGPALMGQGAARDIMMAGLLRLDSAILPMLRAQVHDEIVLSVPAEQAEEVGRAVVEALTFEWRGVPIMADVSKTGTDWSKVYEK